MNYFTGNTNPRGVYISISPVEVGGHFKTFTMLSGISTCVEHLARKSKKRIEYWASKIEPHVDEIIARFKEHCKEAIHYAYERAVN